MVFEEIDGLKQAVHGPMNAMPDSGTEFLSQPSQKDLPGALVLQDEEGREQGEEDFLLQVLQCAREVWESFHLQHSDINEETFVDVERFCIKQWSLQHGIVLVDLPAFEEAEQHFDCEVQQQVAEIGAITEMMADPLYWEAQSLSVYIAAQAQERSKQAREAIHTSRSHTDEYLMGKFHQLRAPEQTQEREQEAQQRLEDVKQDTDYLKALGITIVYENQKEALRERKQALREHMSTLGHLTEENLHRIDATNYIAIFEKYIKNIDILIKDLRIKTVETYRVRDAVGIVSSDWDAARQRAMHMRAQVNTLQEVITAIQAGTEEALIKVQAEREHIRNVKQVLERTRKRCAELETWAQAEKEQAEARKQQSKDLRTIAKRFDQTKVLEKAIKIQEKQIYTIDEAKSKIEAFVKQFESISTSLNDIKMGFMTISQKGVRLALSLKKAMQALEHAIRTAKRSIKDIQEAFERQSKTRVPDQGEDATHAEVRVRQSAREEMQAYAQAKQYAGAALRYLRDISDEYRKVEETSTILMQSFTDLLEGSLPFEQDILDHALSRMKQTVKASMTVLRLEGQVKEATHRMASGVETGQSADVSRLLADEQEALALAALANHALAQCAALYYLSHQLAGHVIKENFEAALETRVQRCDAALEVVKKDLEEMKHQKKSKDMERQTAMAGDAGGQAHLLIDERTGAITLKNAVSAFHLQDIVQISEAPAQEQPGSSRLFFKAGHPRSYYDAPHDLLHEGCETHTRIHLQAPDGAGGHVAMLSLPNGIHIKLADIDLGQTRHDPARPEGGVTITLKQDGRQINLLAAACVMTGSLMQEVLPNIIEKNITRSVNCMEYFLDTKDIKALEGVFIDTKVSAMHIRSIDTYILSSQEVETRRKDLTTWMASIENATGRVITILYKYASEALNEEHGEKEITERFIVEKSVSIDEPDEMYRNRDACLQRIVSQSGLDRIIPCQLFNDPDDSSTGTYSNPTIQELFMEYERARIGQAGEQRQEKRASDKWARYGAHLRRLILDEAPAYMRARFLFSQIREALETGYWEEGTVGNPGVIHLAQELQTIELQESSEDNDYASALQTLTGRAVAGIQDAISTGNPSEVFARIDFLDGVFRTLNYAQDSVWDALKRTTPTAMARQIIEQIPQGLSSRFTIPHD